MILQLILKYRNDSNFAHTFLSIIKSSHANPPEKKFLDLQILDIQGFYCVKTFKIPHLMKKNSSEISKLLHKI